MVLFRRLRRKVVSKKLERKDEVSFDSQQVEKFKELLNKASPVDLDYQKEKEESIKSLDFISKKITEAKEEYNDAVRELMPVKWELAEKKSEIVQLKAELKVVQSQLETTKSELESIKNTFAICISSIEGFDFSLSSNTQLPLWHH